MSTAEALMTAEEFGLRPDPGHPEELVRGRIISMPPPDRRHGFVCGEAYFLLRQFVGEHDLGRVLSNDSGVITERDPDSVRGAAVAYDSYARLPEGPLPTGYGLEVPELIIEVRSAGDRWPKIQEKSSNTRVPATWRWSSIPSRKPPTFSGPARRRGRWAPRTS